MSGSSLHVQLPVRRKRGSGTSGGIAETRQPARHPMCWHPGLPRPLARPPSTPFAPPGQCGYVPAACGAAEAYLSSEVVGQHLAVSQLTDAVCHHLARPRPGRPLVISAHGPPGVGKTLSHQLLARALYSRRPAAARDCPGRDCRGYKVRATACDPTSAGGASSRRR